MGPMAIGQLPDHPVLHFASLHCLAPAIELRPPDTLTGKAGIVAGIDDMRPSVSGAEKGEAGNALAVEKVVGLVIHYQISPIDSGAGFSSMPQAARIRSISAIITSTAAGFRRRNRIHNAPSADSAIPPVAHIPPREQHNRPSAYANSLSRSP